MTVKAAVMAAGYSTPDRLFPDYFAAPDADKAEAEALARGDDVEYDYTDVDWEMPTDTGEDPAETLALLNAMGANLSLTVGDDSWEPEPDPQVEQILAVDDSEREWL